MTCHEQLNANVVNTTTGHRDMNEKKYCIQKDSNFSHGENDLFNYNLIQFKWFTVLANYSRLLPTMMWGWHPGLMYFVYWVHRSLKI